MFFLSTGEFVARFIPDERRRAVVEEGWKDLRTKLLASLQSKYPFLTYAIHHSKISWAEEKLRDARLKYNEGRLDDAIKDAANACEGLLQVLRSKYGLKAEERAQFYDLLCILKDSIIEDFEESTYKDLDLIRDWRNKVVHPSAVRPDDCITLQIVTRAELFFELFKRKMLLRAGRRGGGQHHQGKHS
jgi:HEPN domain-containing protein